jgi:purine nucleoside permease
LRCSQDAACRQRKAELEALKKRQRVGKVDERTLSLIRGAREADAGMQGSKTLATDAQSSDDESEDDLEDDVLGNIAIDWRAKR